MFQPQLPPECITIIIRFIHNNGDTETMARLLRVNKAVCAATLPFLYKGCSRKLTWSSNADQSLKGLQLIRTLLRQIHPQSRIPDILKVAFLSPDKQTDLGSTAQPPPPPPPPMFKYGHFLSTVNICYDLIHSMFESVRDGSPLMDYATTNRLYEKYKDAGYIDNDFYGDSKDRMLQEALIVDIYQQLTWTLCQDHPESIAWLSIPLNDIQQYIDHVHLFTSLSYVNFSIRGMYNLRKGRRNWYTSDLTSGIKETERDRFFKGMVEFVRQHASVHKNVLQDVEIPASHQLYRTGQHSIPSVYYAIQSLLPSFQNLRSLTTGCIKLLARSTDTSCLESMTVLRHNGDLQKEEVSELLKKHPPFLPRHRSLKHLTTETLGPDMFQWAVLEKKKQTDAEHQQESIVDRHLISGQHGRHTNDLVSLQSISISNLKPYVMDQELNDIAFAFSDSLEEWTVEDGYKRYEEPEEEEEEEEDVITHGQGWDLPRLRRLSFVVFGARLHFDMDGLERCRALESLTLHDDLVTYRPQDIHTWSVVCLPHLKRLDLKGSPALHFNMDSLHQSPCLEELSLTMTPIPGDDIDYRIPPLDELENEDLDTDDSDAEDSDTEDPDTEEVDGHESSGLPNSSQEYQSIGGRSQYTWDWHPPNLRKLDLAAIFALMFDLQWLQHVPNLQSLRLDISSDKKAHRRHITVKDLLRREPQHALDEGGSGGVISDQYISLPKLESLALNGQWIFEDKVMKTLCLTVAPNLSSFGYEGRYADLSLKECIALSKKMPRLKKMKLGTCSEDPEKLGLEQKESVQDELLEKGVAFIIEDCNFYLASKSGPKRKSGRK